MEEIVDLKEKILGLTQVGFLDIDIDPSLDLFAEIKNIQSKTIYTFL